MITNSTFFQNQSSFFYLQKRARKISPNTLNNSSAIYVFIRIVLVMVRFMTSGLDIEGYMLEVNMVEGCMVEVNS